MALLSCNAPRFAWFAVVCVPATAILFDSELKARSEPRMEIYMEVCRHGQRRGAIERLAYLTWVKTVKEEESVM